MPIQRGEHSTINIFIWTTMLRNVIKKMLIIPYYATRVYKKTKGGKNTSLPDELWHSTNVIGTGKKKKKIMDTISLSTWNNILPPLLENSFVYWISIKSASSPFSFFFFLFIYFPFVKLCYFSFFLHKRIKCLSLLQ